MNRSIVSFFAGALSAGVGVFLVMFLLLSDTRADLEEQGVELDTARAAVVDLEQDQLVVYCRGVIDQFLGGISEPEIIERNDEICIETMRAGVPRGFRGP